MNRTLIHDTQFVDVKSGDFGLPKKGSRFWATLLVLVAMGASAQDVAKEKPEQLLPEIDVVSLSKQTFVDQFSRQHAFQFPSGHVIVLTANGEAGKSQVQGWTIPLRDEFGEEVRMISVADLSSVPRILRGRFRSKFAREWARPVILDFSGAITGLLPMNSENVIVLIFGRNGELLSAESGQAEPRKLASVATAIRSELIESPSMLSQIKPIAPSSEP